MKPWKMQLKKMAIHNTICLRVSNSSTDLDPSAFPSLNAPCQNLYRFRFQPPTELRRALRKLEVSWQRSNHVLSENGCKSHEVWLNGLFPSWVSFA